MIAEIAVSEVNLDVDWIPCEKCHRTGWLDYEVDYFGRKTEPGRCNALGCEAGMVAQSQGHSATTVNHRMLGA